MASQTEEATSTEAELVPCTQWQLVRYFLYLGALGFGGPIALTGYMQRDLVERRRWLSKEDYVQGLALAQLAPGPLAAQLAIYLGWVRGRIPGASLVGIAFVLPSFVMVFDLPTVLICLVTLGVVTRFKKVQEPLVILVSGALGMALSSFASK